MEGFQEGRSRRDWKCSGWEVVHGGVAGWGGWIDLGRTEGIRQVLRVSVQFEPVMMFVEVFCSLWALGVSSEGSGRFRSRSFKCSPDFWVVPIA